MEVVSPLTFPRAGKGGKRRFGSPIHGASVASANTTTEDFDMDDCSGFGFQAAKRRKRFSNEGPGDPFSFQSKENNWTASPFVQASSRSPLPAIGEAFASPNPSPFFSRPDHPLTLFFNPTAPPGAPGPTAKRTRTDDATAQKLQELQHMVEQQAAEIHRLKSAKESAEASASQLSSQHAKVEQENKILKCAVAIQQDRQNHMTAELEGARQFKSQAEDRIRRLEQMNLTLQYQLQASSSTANDFLGMPPRPPDVY
ncbi:hypothetical protein ACHAWF_017748 [Thalassiosira exigua]